MSTFKTKPPHIEKLLKPHHLVSILYDDLKEKSTKHSAPNIKTTFKITPNRGSKLWLVNNGSAAAYRKRDNLLVWQANGPLIIGLNQLFYQFSNQTSDFYFKITNCTEVFHIEREIAFNIIENKKLWFHVSALLSYYMLIFIFRDDVLVNKSSYEIIREKILEYNFLGLHQSYKIAPYILETTLLSKSIVYRIISDLQKGGYLDNSDGKAVILKELPQKY